MLDLVAELAARERLMSRPLWRALGPPEVETSSRTKHQARELADARAYAAWSRWCIRPRWECAEPDASDEKTLKVGRLLRRQQEHWDRLRAADEERDDEARVRATARELKREAEDAARRERHSETVRARWAAWRVRPDVVARREAREREKAAKREAAARIARERQQKCEADWAAAQAACALEMERRQAEWRRVQSRLVPVSSPGTRPEPAQVTRPWDPLDHLRQIRDEARQGNPVWRVALDQSLRTWGQDVHGAVGDPLSARVEACTAFWTTFAQTVERSRWTIEESEAVGVVAEYLYWESR